MKRWQGSCIGAVLVLLIGGGSLFFFVPVGGEYYSDRHNNLPITVSQPPKELESHYSSWFTECKSFSIGIDVLF